MSTTHRGEDNKASAQTGARAAGSGRLASVSGGAVAGTLVLPALAIAGAPVHASALQMAVALVIAVVVAAGISMLPRALLLHLAGGAMVCAAAWLLAQASYPVAAWIIAPTLGAGVGLVTPAARRRSDATMLFAAAVAAVILAALGLGIGRDAAMAASAVVAAVVAVHAAFALGLASFQVRTVVTGLAALMLAFGTASYIGATTPSATWFGSLVSHGPRDRNEVAITFDDGPNPPFTLQIRDILDQHGAKGTFFTVGKALDARPDVSKALLEDGHLLGNHSYHHDAIRWLDPSYPELQDTQDAFKRNLGVCPALYRPPHGSHTPFMAHVVSDHGMTMVTWDVSAADWATDDGQLVARRVLEKVKPGSIILLHDGIDGKIGADRTVILEALPLILDGLERRGLNPVTLDKLLGLPGYLQQC
jgi:peptidoglycan/xylan/chitin deacetylase (PgdA/CDA1 family)